MTRLSRRTLISVLTGGIVASVLPSRLAHAEPPPYELTPAPLSPDATPEATPQTDTSLYSGDLADVWTAQWTAAGKLIQFDGVVMQRFAGTHDSGYAIGSDGLVFRNVLVVAATPDQQLVFVGINEDIDTIAEGASVNVTGRLSGLTSYIMWGEYIPILSATEVTVVS